LRKLPEPEFIEGEALEGSDTAEDGGIKKRNASAQAEASGWRCYRQGC